MSQVCSQCSRLNPPAAIYCYFDGIALGRQTTNGRRVNAGSQPFPTEFVFPSGKACRTFDQLAIACQENWKAAVNLLKQGFFASFLGAMGRADLALAAQESARFPDTERGLDRLLAQFPSRVLAAPQLRVEPTDVSLGVIPFGTNHKFELHLSNLGMRLLYGSVTSDCRWLTLGDAPGIPQKVFQFGGDGVIPVLIRGQHLRAGVKPLEGHLLVDSNGGVITVTVRAEVPPKPYPSGALAGAATPRQIAEKAQAAPKEAAPLFESGAVAKWFTSNGWVYPVQGPAASGVGAVQQFFEALGLAKAPKIEIFPAALTLQGDVGQSVQTSFELKTLEKRPVYGHAICDQPWLEVTKAALSGRNAVIRVLVPRIPNRPGETLSANVRVTSNGNQKFRVPVSLQIGAQTPREAQAILVPDVDDQLPVASLIPEPAVPARPTERTAPVRSQGRNTSIRSETPEPGSIFNRALPAVLLLLILIAILARDAFFATPTVPTIETDPRPLIAVYFDDDNSSGESLGNMGFGLIALARGNQPEKKLTFSDIGISNSTVLKIDGDERLFGLPIPGQSKWLAKKDPIKSPRLKSSDNTITGMKSVWLYETATRPGVMVSVRVTQTVEIVAGPAELRSGNLKSWLDTCVIRYEIENTGKQETKVGLRTLIDTLIGSDTSNDGVPFTVPGEKGMIVGSKRYESPRQKIPDFLQVLENPDLSDPGIVGFMNLKLGSDVEPPGCVLLTRWTKEIQKWEIPERTFAGDPAAGDKPDSAVVLYWNEKPLAAGTKREVGFSYGLGTLAIAGKKLGISVGGNFVPNGDLTVQALVERPERGQTLTLKLPEGLRIVEGEARQPVPQIEAEARIQQSPVAWRIRADREGTYLIEVISSTGISQKKTISVKTKTIF